MNKTFEIEVAVGGMTCTACANRVEKQLNKIPGIKAYVDFATEIAHINSSNQIDLDEVSDVIKKSGYEPLINTDAQIESNKLKNRVLISALLSGVIAILSMISSTQFNYWQWFVMFLATPVVFWGAAPLHQAAWANLKHRTTTMDTLVSLGVLVAYLWSVLQIVIGDAGSASYRMMFDLFGRSHDMPEIYFEVASVVPTVVLFGRYLEVRTRRSATDAVRALLASVPESALVRRDGKEYELKTSEVKRGDLVIVRSGERFPIDGKVVSGFGSIDSSVITGESLPIEISPGDEIAAGSINLASVIEISATSNGDASRISLIAKLVKDATSQKTKITQITDRISAVFVPTIILLSIATFFGWVAITGNAQAGLTAAVAVLVIACPCALGIAVPMSLVVAASIGAKAGTIIRNPDSLNQLARLTAVVLDKTGTLTSNQMMVTDVVAVGMNNPQEVLAVAAAIERGSTHPIAKAIASADKSLSASNIHETAGVGITGVVKETEVFVGNPIKANLPMSEEMLTGYQKLLANGVVVAVSWGGYLNGFIVIADSLRPSSITAVSELKKLNLKTFLLSGDHETAVKSVAAKLHLDQVRWGVSPEQKFDLISKLKETEVVAMVGDGINDTAALANADIGIAMGTGTYAAQSAADLTIIGDDPKLIAFVIRLANRTRRTIYQNLFWAFIYNLILIPVAAAGLLNPLLAGSAMAFSSVAVVLNSLRMRRFS
ncbi:MAG: cation-translocating P-type ATPase [Actinobacteria bacterium]|nr:cation-translocating P-type ATPase [Actinomycetota bacterium]